MSRAEDQRTPRRANRRRGPNVSEQAQQPDDASELDDALLPDDRRRLPAEPEEPAAGAVDAGIEDSMESDEDEGGSADLVRPRRRPAAADRSAARRLVAPPSPRAGLTIEHAAAVDAPREYRLSPDGRAIAWTAVAAEARQVFVTGLRGGLPRQVTASEKNVEDPQWSPDAARIAYVRDGSIWSIELASGRETLVTQHAAGNRSPRWSPDGRQIAFISRRRGWDQVWRIEAPVPRRGRPPAEPRIPEPSVVTPTGIDVEDFAWSPEGDRIAVSAQREPNLLTSQVTIVNLESGRETRVGGDAWECAARWLPDGKGLLLVSDADGWFQVLRVSADGKERVALTAGSIEHGEPNNVFGFAPLPSPDGSRFTHIAVHDGLVDLVVAPLGPAALPKRGRGRPPKSARLASVVGAGTKLNPFDGVWRAVAWMRDGSQVLAIGESDSEPQDLWLLPVPGSAPEGARARRITSSLPIAFDGSRFIEAERVSFTARDGLRVEGTLWRPADATGQRGGARVPTIIQMHGGPTAQAFRDFQPLRQLFVQEGMAVLAVDFRGSTGYGRAFRQAIRNEWGHADAFDCIDAAKWAAQQPWSDGRLAAYGGSYGGFLTLCVLVEEPGLWRAGVDMFGDSELAESYRHGDRVGRIDLQRWMGSPDDPKQADLYRRGSPLYRAERIEAPLLILHGRKDARVVPLMTEKMVEALRIESKHHEVHWYDDEAHGWERRENRRDAWRRIIEFMRLHLLDRPGERKG